ncbi:hypothetical protein WMY93_022385 [Mugilogobius chulae]|uniref:Tr-type G domain-containing protein n=1 Tax=Mugilogobius chulae TaxID=88201 RepID=A0AAW0N7Z8_9GOBI
MLIIDTPGHESFSNLRNRGSSLCDIAILVVDIMHGLEPQTLESINLLKEKKCPFIVALNKIDRLYDWKKSPDTDVVATLKKQKKNTKDEFDERTKAVIVEFAQQGLNAALFFENKDPRTFVSWSWRLRLSRDGHDDRCDPDKRLPQRRRNHHRSRRRGADRDTDPRFAAAASAQGAQVKNQYEKHKEVDTSQGVKILGKDLEKTLAGLPLLVAHRDDEIPVLRDELIKELKQTLNSIKLRRKVFMSRPRLWDLWRLCWSFCELLKSLTLASTSDCSQKRRDEGVHHVGTRSSIRCDPGVRREGGAGESGDGRQFRRQDLLGRNHLPPFRRFHQIQRRLQEGQAGGVQTHCSFPGRSLKNRNARLCASKGFVDIGVVTSIEMNHKPVDTAKKGQEICVKIEPIPGEAPKMFGRHFEATDIIVSKITRASIDALKNWFRDEMQKTDWQLIMELKKTFEII